MKKKIFLTAQLAIIFLIILAIVSAFMVSVVLPVLAMFVGAVFLTLLDELVDYLTNRPEKS